MSAQCPACSAPQVDGLLCHSCTSTLEYELGDVPAIVAELDVTLSRQSRVGGSGGKGGLASERTPINSAAMLAADYLQNTLTTWARDVSGETFVPGIGVPPSHAAATYLLMCTDLIRKHPAAAELMDEVVESVRQARRAVDRPADRQYLGICRGLHGGSIDTCDCCCHGHGAYPPPCDVPGGCGPHRDGVPCTEELYAAPSAAVARCRTCGEEHDVAARREWLMEQAEDMIFTPREASRYVGEVGHMAVGEQRIRNYVDRKRLLNRPAADGAMRIRLGDLLDLIRDGDERRSA